MIIYQLREGKGEEIMKFDNFLNYSVIIHPIGLYFLVISRDSGYLTT